MNVVWHQAGGEDGDVHAFLRLIHGSDEIRIVAFAMKYPRLLIPAVDHVVAMIGDNCPWRPGHAEERNPWTDAQGPRESHAYAQFRVLAIPRMPDPFC